MTEKCWNPCWYVFICVGCRLDITETPNLGLDHKGCYIQTHNRVLHSWKELLSSQGCVITCADNDL